MTHSLASLWRAGLAGLVVLTLIASDARGQGAAGATSGGTGTPGGARTGTGSGAGTTPIQPSDGDPRVKNDSGGGALPGRVGLLPGLPGGFAGSATNAFAFPPPNPGVVPDDPPDNDGGAPASAGRAFVRIVDERGRPWAGALLAVRTRLGLVRALHVTDARGRARLPLHAADGEGLELVGLLPEPVPLRPGATLVIVPRS